MDDYPVDGEFAYLEEDTEQVAEKAKEIEKAVEAMPLIDDVCAWLEAQIAACDSVANVIKTADDNAWPIEIALKAHDIVANLLTSKREEIEMLKETLK
jgi:hypothetical protein